MKKLLSSLLAVALACGLMAGCNSTIEGQTSAPAASSAGSTSQAESKAESQADLQGSLTLNGSTSMAKVCQALGEAFQGKYTGVTVTKSGNGSGDAVKAVDAGTALIGDLSRAVKDEENPDNYEQVQIAIDGIAIAVNKENPVADLTSEQITKIFTGEITNWKDVGGADKKITVLGREAASGTRDGFETLFNCKEKCAYAIEVTSTGEVVKSVGSDPAAIGYVSLDSVNDTVKAVKVDGVEANEENIKNETYKAQRPFLQIYKKGSDSELIKAWFEFVESDEGQAIIKKVGLINVEK